MFVEVEPGVGLAFADDLPVDCVKNPCERAKRGFERLFAAGVIGEELQGGAD